MKSQKLFFIYSLIALSVISLQAEELKQPLSNREKARKLLIGPVMGFTVAGVTAYLEKQCGWRSSPVAMIGACAIYHVLHKVVARPGEQWDAWQVVPAVGLGYYCGVYCYDNKDALAAFLSKKYSFAKKNNDVLPANNISPKQVDENTGQADTQTANQILKNNSSTLNDKPAVVRVYIAPHQIFPLSQSYPRGIEISVKPDATWADVKSELVKTVVWSDGSTLSPSNFELMELGTKDSVSDEQEVVSFMERQHPTLIIKKN